MLNVARLRVLLELQRRGTLAAVAEALAYSPSAVSQQLSALAAEVRAPLVEHVGRRLVLTPHAEILARHAATLLAQLEEAEAELAQSLAGLRGTVRVAAFQTAFLVLVPSLVAELADHPDVELRVVHVQPDHGFDALATHECDLLVAEEYPGFPLSRPPHVETSELARDPLRLVGVDPAGDPFPAAVRDAAWVMEPTGNAARRWATALCREAGFEPRVTMETPDLLVQARIAATGRAVAVLPDLVWSATGERVATAPLPGAPHRRILTATRVGAADQPLIRLVRQKLEHAVGALATAPTV